MKKLLTIILLALVLTGCMESTENTENKETQTKQTSVRTEEKKTSAEAESNTPAEERSMPEANKQGEESAVSPTEEENLVTGFVLTCDADKDSTLVGSNLYASEWKESPSIEINGNKPFFTEADIKTLSEAGKEIFAEHDSLGRCGQAAAYIGYDMMPTEERGEIGMVRPTGFSTSKYPEEVIEDLFLWNRCHIIAFELTGQNDNDLNLITGTRYMNVEGMLPFENKVASYLRLHKDKHVVYRVTPEYKGNDLVAQGVLIEAYSIEDNGKSINFCVFCPNVQPYIDIDYATGDNKLSESYVVEHKTEDNVEHTYILNTNSKKIHIPECESVSKMSEKNKQETHKSIEELMTEGYKPCGNCNAGR